MYAHTYENDVYVSFNSGFLQKFFLKLYFELSLSSWREFTADTQKHGSCYAVSFQAFRHILAELIA